MYVIIYSYSLTDYRFESLADFRKSCLWANSSDAILVALESLRSRVQPIQGKLHGISAAICAAWGHTSDDCRGYALASRI